MEEDKGKWEELIRSKIYDYEVDTSPDDWETLSAELEGGKIVRLPLSRKLIYAFSAAAVIALFIIGTFYLFSDSERGSNVQVAVENTFSPIVDNSPKTAENETIQVESIVDNPVDNPINNLLAVTVIQEKKVDKTALDTKEESMAQLKPHLADETDSAQKQEEKKEFPERLQENRTDAVTMEKSQLAVVSPVTKRRRWGFGMGGGGYAVNSTSGGIPVVTSSGVMQDDEYMHNGNEIMLRSGNPNASLFDPVDGFTNSINDDLMGKVTHKTPISAGLGVSYYLTDRWTLHSGVVYTLLRSKGSYVDNVGNPASWKQNLHFIGIPLSASYTFAEWKRIRFYISAGGMGELNVAGKQKKTITVDNLETLAIDKIRMEEPLWSVNSRAGAVYPLWKFVNVYAESGVSYYFDNKSPIETIRSVKPFNISLQAGIRLGF